MLQLELFPRTELRSLSDFQKLEAHQLSLHDKKLLIESPDFYQTPKANDVIRRQHAQLVDKILGL